MVWLLGAVKQAFAVAATYLSIDGHQLSSVEKEAFAACGKNAVLSSETGNWDVLRQDNGAMITGYDYGSPTHDFFIAAIVKKPGQPNNFVTLYNAGNVISTLRESPNNVETSTLPVPDKTATQEEMDANAAKAEKLFLAMRNCATHALTN